MGVQGRICDVPGDPVEDTVWQLCWLSTLLCSWRAPRKKWRHDVGHERGTPYDCYRVPLVHSKVLPVVGVQGRICDVPGVLWRTQCGSVAGFHIAMFLEGPKKEVDARCRSWKGTPYDCYRVPPVHSKVLPVVGVQGRICDVPWGSCEGDSMAALLAFHIAMFLEGPPKEVEIRCRAWKCTPYDCYRVPPVHSKVLPVVGVQGRICDVPWGSCDGHNVAVLLASTLLCSWRAQKTEMDAWCRSWKGTPYDCYRVPPVHSTVLPVVGVQGRICDVPSGSCGGHSVAALLAFHIAMFLEVPKKEVETWCRSWKCSPYDCYRVPLVHSKVLPVVGVQGRICDVPGDPVEDTVWQLCWLSTLLCSWRAPKKKWMHDVGHERVPPMTVTGSHQFIVKYFQLWGCKDGYVMCLGGPVRETVWQLCWLSTLLCSWRAPQKKWRYDVGHESVPLMTVTGSHRFIVRYFQLWGCKDGYVMCLGGPVRETVWQLCWLSTLLCSWRDPQKKWRYDVGHESEHLMTVTGSHWFIVRYFQLWGCKDGYVMCLGSCGGHSVAALLAFHIAMFLEGPKKEVEARCRSWKGTPCDCYRVPLVHSKVLPVVGVQGRICDVPGGPVRDTVWQLYWLSTLLCSWRAPRKKWRHDVGHERVPPMTVTGSHRFIIRYFQLWGCKDGYVMCLGVLWGTQCGSFTGFPHRYVPGGPQERSGGTWMAR